MLILEIWFLISTFPSFPKWQITLRGWTLEMACLLPLLPTISLTETPLTPLDGSGFGKLKLQLSSKLSSCLSAITDCLLMSYQESSIELCPGCNNSTEDLNHLFRGCYKSIELWNTLNVTHLIRVGFESPVKDWITLQLKKKRSISSCISDLHWNTLFLTSLWQIWKDRNKKSFDNIDTSPTVSSKAICLCAWNWWSFQISSFKWP